MPPISHIDALLLFARLPYSIFDTTHAEDAFNAIALLDPATVYNDVRLEAIAKIDAALEAIVEGPRGSWSPM